MNFFLKHFIKDYENTKDINVRTSYGKLGATIGIVTNLILIAIKVVAGLFANSIALIGSALDSIADMGSSIVTLVGFKVSSKPADKEHPYGHQRVEYVTGLVISIIIIVIAIELLITSIQKIITPEVVTYSVLTFVILGISILIKIGQCFVYRGLAKRINSVALFAASVDARNDVLSLSTILVGTIVALVANVNLDGYLGVLVAIFVFISGISLVKDSINPLLGIKPDQELVNNIIADIRKHPEVLGFHDFYIHSYGASRAFASMHIEMDGKRDAFKSHQILDGIEREIKDKYQVELVIHWDPVHVNDQELKLLKKAVLNLLHQIDPKLKMHDFQKEVKGDKTLLLFDVVLPEQEELSQATILEQLNQGVKKLNLSYEIEVEFDDNYLGQEASK